MTQPADSVERDYVLGTHDAEVDRLGLQHRVWFPRVMDAWQRAGFARGQTIVDVGCGPGWASLDLAEMVGADGRVIAVDRSRRFLDVLSGTSARRGIANIERHELDCDTDALPGTDAHGAWMRWVFAFVRRPRELVRQVHGVLRPGAALVVHEYFDYGTWRLMPQRPEIEDFVRVVMDTWRSAGGEPDIALSLPAWLAEGGFAVESVRPYVDVVPPGAERWKWLAEYVRVGLKRLADTGAASTTWADGVTAALTSAESTPSALMISPGVLEIIARRQ